MTNQSEERNQAENTKAADQPQRISKRETIAAFYERMLSGSRRVRSAAQSTDDAAPATEPAESTKSTMAEETPTEATPPTESTVGTRSEMEWNDLISHRIDEAMRNGAFDNLRNKGKPLPQDYNPHVPEDRRMANDLLKNNGLAPQWIGDRAGVLHQIDAFRTKFHKTATGYQTAWHAHSSDVIVRQQLREQWERQLETWQEEIRLLNRRIEIVNLQQPIARLEIFKLLLPEELKRVGMEQGLA